MKNNIRSILTDPITRSYGSDAPLMLSYLPDMPIDLSAIRAVMINEVVAEQPDDDFYSCAEDPYYMQTTLTLFQQAGAPVRNISDILDRGIYITSAVKYPKTGTTVTTDTIRHYLPILQQELALFPSLQAVMLMGDVARKAFNMIAKNETGKNAIPAGSTYKLRHSQISWQGLRLLPAYIMTGKNLAIEKSKTAMSAEEITKMLTLIGAIK